ncbi:hypothetical protein ACIRFH_13465 [Streptomyces sp. NPDC093586]|uniref:hypothetical protein n=1 Tax=Streptomyces sp. NPDC093586 TaxID=3366042 RepID=UPI003821DC11
MLFKQLMPVLVQTVVSEMLLRPLGAACVALLALVALGVRARSLPLATPAAVLFVLLMTQA